MLGLLVLIFVSVSNSKHYLVETYDDDRYGIDQLDKNISNPVDMDVLDTPNEDPEEEDQEGDDQVHNDTIDEDQNEVGQLEEDPADDAAVDEEDGFVPVKIDLKQGKSKVTQKMNGTEGKTQTGAKHNMPAGRRRRRRL